MTPQKVNDIIAERVADMSPAERAEYDAELEAARAEVYIGDLLRRLREHSGLGRRILGTRLHVSARRIARYESGRTDVPLSFLARAAEAAGHTVTIRISPSNPEQEGPPGRLGGEAVLVSSRASRHATACRFVAVSEAGAQPTRSRQR